MGRIFYRILLMGAAESTIFVIVLVSFLFSAYIFIRAWLFNEEVKGKTLTLGVNGKEGDTVTLTCPSGMNINMYKATYLCSGVDPNGFEAASGLGGCDPISLGNSGDNTNYGNFSSYTTANALTDLSGTCNGKNTCSFTVPASTTVKPCNGKECPIGSNLYVTGTYFCTA